MQKEKKGSKFLGNFEQKQTKKKKRNPSKLEKYLNVEVPIWMSQRILWGNL